MRGPAAFLLAAALCAEVAYQKPPKAVLDVLHAPLPPRMVANPGGTHVLLLDRRPYPPIAELAAPMLRLAGLRVNPATNGPHSEPFVYTGVSILETTTGARASVGVPSQARLGAPVWSPDGRAYFMANTTATGIELYVGSTSGGALRRIPGVQLNDTSAEPAQWMAGSEELLVHLVPPARGRAPLRPAVPTGPAIEESAGNAEGVWTFQDLLSSPHDEALFDYYVTSQLAVVSIATGSITPVGSPHVFLRATPSPSGAAILVTRIRRPYSYVLPYSRFGQDTEVWDRSGNRLHRVAALPLQDKVPTDGVPQGPRNAVWRPSEPATLVWFEALDGGDPRKKAPHRDRVIMLKGPGSGAPTEVFQTKERATGIEFGERGGLAIVSDFGRERRWIERTRIFLDDPGAQPKVISSRDSRDRYGDPGSPLTTRLPNGGRVLVQNGDWVFLTGTGATPEGDRPFLRRLNLATLETSELFRSPKAGYEDFLALASTDGSRFLTTFETPSDPPNLILHDGPARKQLSSFKDPTPQIRGITKQRVTYKRDDGVDLSFTLYLPPGFQQGTRLPAVLWAYPLEYNDAATAGQISGSTQRYTTLSGSSHLFLLLSGYAILNDATIPIVGGFDTANNTYVEQLTASAKAAIEKAAAMGVIDPNRIGVSGHSYGGFMTANLLAHTDLFRAGVARSGAYNRTLTPFGFQSERRTWWQARETYLKMSPFNFANQINEPLLLIHGQSDNNAGTFPLQSERLYQAVRGHGTPVRLVMLPHESHGYAARESIEHTLWETFQWFDKHIKNAPAVRSTR